MPSLHSDPIPVVELVPALPLVEAGVEVARHDRSGVALLARNYVQQEAFFGGSSRLD